MKRRRSSSAKASWTAALAKLPALSVHQPWAWLPVSGYKDVENRSWATKHRGPLLIHAGLSTANLSEEKLREAEQRYGVRCRRAGNANLAASLD